MYFSGIVNHDSIEALSAFPYSGVLSVVRSKLLPRWKAHSHLRCKAPTVQDAVNRIKPQHTILGHTSCLGAEYREKR